jgi:hypothetical protein
MKLVSESYEEFQKNKELDEGIKNVVQKAVKSVKNMFKKAGKFFVGLGKNGEEIVTVVPPVNIAIMIKDEMINPAISIIPSKEDIELDPSLQSETEEKLLAKRESISESYAGAAFVKNKLFEIEVPLQHPDKDIGNVDEKEFKRLLRLQLNNPRATPLLVWGAIGVGKTQIVKAVIKARGAGRVVDVPTSKMQPDDWALPATYNVKDFSGEETGTILAKDVPKDWLPCYLPSGDADKDAEQDEIANMGAGGIIFFDELSRANPMVQNTCLKIMDERLIGDYVLGSKWSLIAASNREEDEEDGIHFEKALGNRFTQLNYEATHQDFRDYATGTKRPYKPNKGRRFEGKWGGDQPIDQRIIDFLDFHPDLFYTATTGENQTIFASPRSWKNASDKIGLLIQDAAKHDEIVTERDISNMLGYHVGMGIAEKFNTFIRIMRTFSPEDIRKVLEDPMKAKLPKKTGSSFDPVETGAFLSLACSATSESNLSPEQFANWARYLVRLNNATLAVKGFTNMISYHEYIRPQTGEKDKEGNVLKDKEGKAQDTYQEGYDIFIKKYGDDF